jgi:hypothetical protein
LGLEVGDEFGGAVLQAEQEEQQDDADFGAGGGELLAGVEREDAAVAEGESGQEVEGYGGEAHSSCEASQQSQGEDDGPEFDEHGGGVVHGRLLRFGSATASVPCRVRAARGRSP